ncbi:hypothetical protein LguiB_034925 [Lonicera macranthoides]
MPLYLLRAALPMLKITLLKKQLLRQVYPPLREDSIFYEPTYGQIDCKVFSPLPSQIQTELRVYMDSPFADNFGNDHNGFHFQDGTCEQDASLTELLEVLQNHDELSCEDSNGQKNSGFGSENQMCGNIHWFPHALPGDKDQGFYNDADTDMGQMQMQMSPKSYRGQASICDPELGPGNNVGAIFCNYIGKDSSSDYMGSFNKLEESTSQTNPNVTRGSNLVAGRKIKIRDRQQPQKQSSSGNVATQGTATRRVRFQSKLVSGSCCYAKVGDSNGYNEEQEAQSVVTEGSEENNATTEEDSGASKLVEFDEDAESKSVDSNEPSEESSTGGLKLRMKQGGGTSQTELSASSKAPVAINGLCFSSVYLVCLPLIVIVFVISVGIWK